MQLALSDSEGALSTDLFVICMNPLYALVACSVVDNPGMIRCFV